MSIVPRGMSITEAYRLYRSGNLLVNRKYQRKLIWSIDEKSKLIGSILKGYPIPLILLAERPQVYGNGKYEIIDGMQRLNAICGFIENLYSFNSKYFDVNEFSYAKKLAEENVFGCPKNCMYLSREECSDILDYQVAVTIYTAMDEVDVTEVFGRINSGGKHLSNQEKRQAGVTTPFAEIVRKISMKLRGDDTAKLCVYLTCRKLALIQKTIIKAMESKQKRLYGVSKEFLESLSYGIVKMKTLLQIFWHQYY